MKKFVFALICGLLLFSCNPDHDFVSEEFEEATLDERLKELLIQEGGSLEHFILPKNTDFNAIPQDPKNPITREKVELGKLLFHETGLAVKSNFEDNMSTYSCASCHHKDAGFQANVPQGIGDGGMGYGAHGEGRVFNPLCDEEKIDVQPIRSPSTLNIAYQTNILWNGQFGATHLNEGTEDTWAYDTPLEANHLGYQGVETQAVAGLDVHRFGLSITKEFIESTVYKELFQVAFPNHNEEFIYSIEAAGLAIAAYERTLLSNESNWQKWLNGNQQAMSFKELEGAISFFEYGCGSCHTGPALSSMEFHAFGMNDLKNSEQIINVTEDHIAHLGRGGFTNNPEDLYKFKVPQLYNLKDSKFYGHGSSFQTVREVVEYKNTAISENSNVSLSQLSSYFKPLNMSEEDIDNISHFIENSLYDPNLERYVPEELPTGQCFPNNDALSRVDLGCF